DEQLDDIYAGDKLEVESANARLTINAPSNTRANSGIDPARQARRGKALNEIQRICRRRPTEGTLKWCGTRFPTNALAQEAGTSLAEYERFVYSAMFLDKDDPAAAWQEFSKEQQKKADFLETVKTLRIVAKD